ncbi:hydroxymethylglutaryl-CoA reductase, degradative [Aerococcaceae bacterium WGS1372]
MDALKYFSGFYKHSISHRIELLERWLDIDLKNTNLDLDESIANQMVENYVYNYALPQGVAVNISVNDIDYVVPMAIEEPSVIAAASYGGKLLGNIQAETLERLLVGQVIMVYKEEIQDVENIIAENKQFILEQASKASQSMVNRGGGPRDIWVEEKIHSNQKFISVYLSLDPCDAMGANVINTVLEAISPLLENLINAQVLMAILSNYQPTAATTATVSLPISVLSDNQQQAEQIAQKIQWASDYAQIDPYRAATHNKGIMNGIDAIVVATGNDWRAIEAGAHAYAARDGKYSGLSTWTYDQENKRLEGRIGIPLQVATVGGTLSNHPTAKANLNLLQINSSKELANVIASVGLIQNFAALRALVSEGIQKGHMRMQARSLALQVGASIEEIPELVRNLHELGQMNRDTAKQLLDQLRKKQNKE